MRIDNYVGEVDEALFLENQLLLDAVIRNLKVIGEACNNINKKIREFAEANPELPLTFAYEMRNVLSHGYFQIDLEIVWRTIQKDLPTLYRQVLEIMEDYEKEQRL